MPIVGRMSEGLESDDASEAEVPMSRSDVDQINDEMEVDEEVAQQEDAEDAEVAVDAPEEEEPSAEDKDIEIEEEELPEDNSELEVLSSSPPPEEEDMAPTPQPRLRIKLKLPTQGAPSRKKTIVSTPEEAEASSSRRETSRDVDIESEDSDDADSGESTRSTSVATTGTAGRALTARQAVLANVVDPTHVSLAEAPNSRKKKPLTEIEIALKREETARKRRNLSEKKLEDEKTETINRLLKKQSRAKGRRNALSTAEDRPTQAASASNVADADAEDGVDVDVPEPVIPTMYRWISTTRGGPGQGQKNDDSAEERTMTLSFAVPLAVLPQTEEPISATKMDIDRGDQPQPQCDVQGCTERRKYRWVKDWGKGACGVSHLKVLETQLA